MSKEQYFNQLDNNVFKAPSTDLEATWYFEWLSLPGNHALMDNRVKDSHKELAASAFTKRVKMHDFFASNASMGKSTFRTVFDEQTKSIKIHGLLSTITINL